MYKRRRSCFCGVFVYSVPMLCCEKNEEVVLAPRRGAKDPQLPEVGLLLPNPEEAEYAARLARQMGGEQAFLFNSRLTVVQGDHPFFVAGPAVGAPMAVLTAEKLIACGARRLIVAGACGALKPGLAIGDVVLPTHAVSEEGTSRHYPAHGEIVTSPGLRLKLAAFLDDLGCPSTVGPVWTTDAPYRETRTKVQAYTRQGIVAVDMEYSALLSLAAWRGIECAGIFWVSDELWQESWKSGFTSKSYRKHWRHLVASLLQVSL